MIQVQFNAYLNDILSISNLTPESTHVQVYMQAHLPDQEWDYANFHYSHDFGNALRCVNFCIYIYRGGIKGREFRLVKIQFKKM